MEKSYLLKCIGPLSLGFALVGLALVVGSNLPLSSALNAKVVSDGEVSDFIRRVKNELVFVGGGRFMMGDYGERFGTDGLPYDIGVDSKPLHKVVLKGYSISKFKITNSDYNFYIKHTRQEVDAPKALDSLNPLSDHPRLPAHLDWLEASKYCHWLGEMSGLPFRLPTEAQWEYAARSGGLFVAIATDDGTFRKTEESYDREGRGPRGLNMATSTDRQNFARKMGWNSLGVISLPVDMFPPNPLGLYAMTDNGFEWVADWYDPEYYKVSPVNDPVGPQSPSFKGRPSDNHYVKVLRGVDYGSSFPFASTISRNYGRPDAKHKSPLTGKYMRVVSDKTARCVVASASPVD